MKRSESQSQNKLGKPRAKQLCRAKVDHAMQFYRETHYWKTIFTKDATAEMARILLPKTD